MLNYEVFLFFNVCISDLVINTIIMLILILYKIFLKYLISHMNESGEIVTLEFITLLYRVRIMLVERRSQHHLRIL